jgi:hypothetical protein
MPSLQDRPPEEQPLDFAGLSAKRHPHADFLSALRGNIRSFRQVDADRIIAPFQAVVSFESRPQAAGINANDRIGFCVEG